MATSREEDLERDLVSAFDRLQPLFSVESVFRSTYIGASRTTKWRRKKVMEEALKEHRPINTYFRPAENSCTAVSNSSDDDHGEHVDDMDDVDDVDDVDSADDVGEGDASFDWKDKDHLKKAHEDIQRVVETFTSPVNDIKKSHAMRYLSVKFYIEKLKEGMNRGKASKSAANFFYIGKEAKEHDYRSRVIRKWATEFVSNGVIIPSQQGKHTKKVRLCQMKM
ncbi:hypothetical protein DFQ30_003889 [Apophysomyces sp. BC1015]|nr:hypothetical protein DFQ30_003889 [Apophysomyces sp. BC1015]KAG0164103.1 hypothetical protein DFQ29_002484 [Apophysomyces sp. BC1021]